MELDRIKAANMEMPHSNEREWVKLDILRSAVLRRRDRFVRTDCYNCAVSLFHISKHPSAPPPTSLVLTLPFAYFPFFPALCSLFLLLAVSCDCPSCFFYLLFPQPQRLNELRPHFLQLSVFVRLGPHFFPPPP